MGTKNEDTDPSSPSALRPRPPHALRGGHEAPPPALRALREAATSPSPTGGEPLSGKPTTDPGLGPGVGPAGATPVALPARRGSVTVPPPSTRHAQGPHAITPPDLRPIPAPIAAPSSGVPAALKDSVELLLEGMAGPRPDRRKTKPQSDGEASAAYHAAHGVRRARSSSEPGPKVVVERTSSPRAVSGGERTPAPPGSPVGEALSTFVPGRALHRRVAVALVAGLLIALLVFVGMRLNTGGPDGARPAVTAATDLHEPLRAVPAAPPLRAVPAAPAEAPAPVAPSADTAAAVSPPPPSPPSPSAEVSVRPTPARPSSTPTTRHRPGSAEPGGDLGEFKAKF